MRQITRIFLISFVLSSFPIATALAIDASLPHSFTAGTTARASEVNANFTELETAVNSKQDRVTGTCTAGSSIRVINADGTVVCEPDTVGSGGGDGHSLDASDGSPTDAVYVNSLGNVGIGTTAPGGKLQVQHDSTHYVRTNVGTDEASTTYNSGTHTWKAGLDGFNGNWYMVTHGTTDYLQIHSSGTVNFYENPLYLRNTYSNSITTGRDLYISSIGEVGFISSSRRYKKNIRSLDEYSSKIFNLNPVAFDHNKDDSAKNLFGLIAEEVDSVIPELVSYNRENKPETVLYSKLVPLLLNEMKHMNEKNEILSNKVRELEKKLESLMEIQR